MLRSLLCSLVLATASYAAPSDLIRENGLQGAMDILTAQDTLTDSDRLALGSITFLRGIERAYQTRWQVGLTEGLNDIPVLRGDLPPNRAPAPITADTINVLFEQVLADMAAADAVLAEIPQGAEVEFVLALPDLWFDVNINGTRDANEDFRDIILHALMSQWQLRRWLQDRPADAPDPFMAEIRFDTADLYWLRAYTDALSGFSELLLAFDPSPEIAQVLELRMAIAEQTQGGNSTGRGFLTSDDALWADVIATIVDTLRHDPDPARIQNAQAHFLSMIAHNRVFWTALDAETDNDREWIPNENQTAALGFIVPTEAGDAWLDVLTDIEMMLKGELVIGHWRFADGYGINVQAYVDDPAPLSLIGWIQGTDALPFVREGDRITAQAMNRFESMTRGGTGMFMLLFN